jgi:CRP-like cAMP-binding protein
MMHELTRGATLVSLPPHSSLCDEGGPLPGLCVVLQGTVFASRVTESRVKRGKASSRQMVISGPARLHAAGGVSARRILEGVVAGMADEECVAAYSNGDSFGHSIATHASAVSRATVSSRAESAEIMCIPARNFEQFSDLIRSQSELDMRLLASMASSLTVPAHLRLDEEVFCISRMLSSLASLQGKGMDVLLRIAKRAYRRKLVAGEVLDVEGDEIGRFNLVVSGRIEAWKGMSSACLSREYQCCDCGGFFFWLLVAKSLKFLGVSESEPSEA